MVELEPQQLAVERRRLDVPELLDEPDGLECLRRRGVTDRLLEIAEQRQRLGLRGDRCRPEQSGDRRRAVTGERVDLRETDEGREVGAPLVERGAIGRSGCRGVAGESGVLADRIVVEPDVLGIVRDGGRASPGGALERTRRIAGDGLEPRGTDQHRGTRGATESCEIRLRIGDPAELDLGVEPRREGTELARIVAQQPIGGCEGAAEVMEREEDRRFGGAGRSVGRLDAKGRPRGSQRALVIREVIAQAAATLIEDREIRRR